MKFGLEKNNQIFLTQWLHIDVLIDFLLIVKRNDITATLHSLTLLVSAFDIQPVPPELGSRRRCPEGRTKLAYSLSAPTLRRSPFLYSVPHCRYKPPTSLHFPLSCRQPLILLPSSSACSHPVFYPSFLVPLSSPPSWP